jgi:hypothetical protein
MLDINNVLNNFLATSQWYKPPIQGNPNVGRFGHSAAVIGSKMYIFGGQSDGYYLNDLVTFDLQTRKLTQYISLRIEYKN